MLDFPRWKVWIVSLVVLAGVLATPLLIDLIAPGFRGETRVLAIRIVRVLFPGMGLLVLSAWCLGILNSHRRFFLPYAAPVVWNIAIIASLFIYGGRVADTELAVVAAWGSVIGSALQLLVQPAQRRGAGLVAEAAGAVEPAAGGPRSSRAADRPARREPARR